MSTLSLLYLIAKPESLHIEELIPLQTTLTGIPHTSVNVAFVLPKMFRLSRLMTTDACYISCAYYCFLVSLPHSSRLLIILTAFGIR